MKRNSSLHLSSYLFIAFFILGAFGISTAVHAWGAEGHNAVGILALRQLQPGARDELGKILGSIDDQAMVEACNWPDTIREKDEWAWSAPLHYINIPHGISSYSEVRDCPQQQCATEAIKKYARELGNRRASQERRRQAFAWLCHVTGDLHQPLHAGFADDRGGNNFEITFAGEATNLHSFWDHSLIETRAGDWQTLVRLLADFPAVAPGSHWTDGMVDDWTNESHALVQRWVYTTADVIGKDYEEQSWEMLQQRITTAASRLAMIVNTVLNPPGEDG